MASFCTFNLAALLRVVDDSQSVSESKKERDEDRGFVNGSDEIESERATRGERELESARITVHSD